MMRRALRKLTPPAIWRLFVGNSRASHRASSTSPGAPITIPERGPKLLNHLMGEPTFSVPMDRVRYPDGRRYVAAEHHFMRYYVEGLPALRRYYESRVPATIYERFFLETPARDAPSAYETPWLAYASVRVFRGEQGLGPEHGIQDFGPVSDDKVQLEAKRLDDVRASIAERGFLPELGGYVQGYFMIAASGEWVFTVRGGFHRTAAMAHLGFEALPAQFFPRYPRFVEEADAACWPMVADGRLAEADARAMFGQFFRSPIYLLPT